MSTYISGLVKLCKGEGSKWEPYFKKAVLNIYCNKIYPLVYCRPDPRFETTVNKPLTLSFIDLVDCKMSEPQDKIYLMFRQEQTFTTVELHDILSADGVSVGADLRLDVFSDIFDRATKIRSDLLEPFVVNLPAPYGNPKTFDFEVQADVQSAFATSATEAQFRIGEESIVAVVPSADMVQRGLGADAAALGASWIVVDCGSSGVSSVPINQALQFQLYPEDLQVSLILPDARLSPHAGAFADVRADAVVAVALLFHDNDAYTRVQASLLEGYVAACRPVGVPSKDDLEGTKELLQSFSRSVRTGSANPTGRPLRKIRTAVQDAPKSEDVSVAETTDAVSESLPSLQSYEAHRAYAPDRVAPESSSEGEDHVERFTGAPSKRARAARGAGRLNANEVRITPKEFMYYAGDHAPKAAARAAGGAAGGTEAAPAAGPPGGTAQLSNTAQFLCQKSLAMVARDTTLNFYSLDQEAAALSASRQKTLQPVTMQFTTDCKSVFTPSTVQFDPQHGGSARQVLATSLTAYQSNDVDSMDTIYITDIERAANVGTISAFSSAGDTHLKLVDFAVSANPALGSIGGSQIGTADAVIVLTKGSLKLLDRRLAGGKQNTDIGFSYRQAPDFSAVIITPRGNVVCGTQSGEIKMFSKMDKRALTAFSGLGFPVMALAITRDERWLVATTHHILFVYSLAGETSSAFAGNGLKTGERTPPFVLRLAPETMLKVGLSSTDSLKPCTIDADETTLFTGTESYVLMWDFEKVKRGIVDSSMSCKPVNLRKYVIGAGAAETGRVVVGTSTDLKVRRFTPFGK